MYHPEYEQLPPLRFTHVIFDLDSLLVTIEGIDELAEMNHVAHLVKPLTTQAMNREKTFEEVFDERLEIIKPTKKNLHDLGGLYCQSFTPGAQELVSAVQQRGAHAYIISGGYNPAVMTAARALNIPEQNVFANELTFDAVGNYNGVYKENEAVPLWRNDGKHVVIRTLMEKHKGTFAFVSDSDWDAGQLVDRYICFAGVAYRPQVVEKAQFVITTPNLHDVFSVFGIENLVVHKIIV